MKESRIHLVLTDDWELRGDGSGNMRHMQFATIRKLVSIYNEFGLKGTFMAEVMQQVHHRRVEKLHPELAGLADEWDDILRGVYSQGHDVQMHLHPQWHGAVYQNAGWILDSPWALSDYSAAVMRAMLAGAKNYLEDLLRPIDSSYRCCVFRAGSWLAFPCEHLLPALADLGIVADLSVVPGWNIDSVFRGQRLFADYRHVEEKFLPYYPAADAPLRAGARGPVHCVPTHTFLFSPVRKFQRRAMKALGIARHDLKAPNAVPPPGAGGNTYDRKAGTIKPARSRWRTKVENLVVPSLRVSDLCALSFWEAKEMLRHIRSEARKTTSGEVPVVITNHTKDIGDFDPIRRFAEKLASATDIQVITARALCDNLLAGRYPVREGKL